VGFQVGSRRFGTTRVDGNLFTKFGPNFLFEVVRPARGSALHTTSAALGGLWPRASPPHRVVRISLRDAFPILVLVVMYLERMVIVRAVCKQQARVSPRDLHAALRVPISSHTIYSVIYAHLYLCAFGWMPNVQSSSRDPILERSILHNSRTRFD
jgi:hypothetical protein